jgi:hypothetical protein
MIIEYSSGRVLTSKMIRSAQSRTASSKTTLLLAKQRPRLQTSAVVDLSDISTTKRELSLPKMNPDLSNSNIPVIPGRGKKDLRALELILKKNKQEANQLEQLNKKISNQYDDEDTRWLRNFIDARNFIKDIAVNTNNSTHQPSEKKSSLLSKVAEPGGIQIQRDNNSSFSNTSSNTSTSSYLPPNSKSSNSSNRDGMAKSDDTLDISFFMPDSSTGTSISTESRRTKSTRVHFDEDALNKEITQVIDGGNRTNTEPPVTVRVVAAATVFPFELPKCYTSMLGDRFDRDDRTVGPSLAKADQTERYARTAMSMRLATAQSNLTASSASTQRVDSSLAELKTSRKFRYRTNPEYRPTLFDYNEMLTAHKSVRRPQQRRAHVSNEAVIQAKFVEKRASKYKERNHQMFDRESRNVRYGAPFVPKKMAREEVYHI